MRKESCADVAKSLGLLDDMRSLPPYTKLLGQIVALVRAITSPKRV